jgi:hypothetical protein
MDSAEKGFLKVSGSQEIGRPDAILMMPELDFAFKY